MPHLVPAVNEYESHLYELHRLIRAGEGDSDAAEAIREQMDLLWPNLESDEESRIRALSADLEKRVHDLESTPAAPSHSR